MGLLPYAKCEMFSFVLKLFFTMTGREQGLKREKEVCFAKRHKCSLCGLRQQMKRCCLFRICSHLRHTQKNCSLWPDSIEQVMLHALFAKWFLNCSNRFLCELYVRRSNVTLTGSLTFKLYKLNLLAANVILVLFSCSVPIFKIKIVCFFLKNNVLFSQGNLLLSLLMLSTTYCNQASIDPFNEKYCVIIISLCHISNNVVKNLSS
jgi:hypothetical protein